MNSSANKMTPPVSVGDEVDVYIQSVGGKGDGVAKVKGFVVIVPETSKGDSVRIKITKAIKATVLYCRQR